MNEFIGRVLWAISQWQRGLITDAQLLQSIEIHWPDDDEYVTLDHALSAGRHDEGSGVNLGEELK